MKKYPTSSQSPNTSTGVGFEPTTFGIHFWGVDYLKLNALSHPNLQCYVLQVMTCALTRLGLIFVEKYSEMIMMTRGLRREMGS